MTGGYPPMYWNGFNYVVGEWSGGGCDHEWADTGFKVTFCKKCDCAGVWEQGNAVPASEVAGYKGAKP